MRNMLVKILLLLSMTVSAYADIIDDSEFGGLCVMGLAEGKIIKTDCEVTWLSDDKKTYCFQSEDAKSVFTQDSARNRHVLGRFNTSESVGEFITFLHHHMPHTSGQVFNLDSRILP